MQKNNLYKQFVYIETFHYTISMLTYAALRTRKSPLCTQQWMIGKSSGNGFPPKMLMSRSVQSR